MTQNPYSQFGSPGSQPYGGDFIDPVASRTSVLAIVGLVISIIGCIACIVPAPGSFAAIFGGLGLFFIARSSGRLRGTGIAITAIVLGLFQSVFCIAVWTSAAQANHWFNTHMVAPISSTMSAIDKGDMKEARAMLSKEASAAISDEMLRDFAQRYRAEVGGFQKTPQSMWETMTMWSEFIKTAKKTGNRRGPVFQPQGPDPQFPTPARFDNGLALVIIDMDVRHEDHVRGTPMILNIGVITLNGAEIWLVDPADIHKLLKGTRAPGTAPAVPAPPSPPASLAPPSSSGSP